MDRAGVMQWVTAYERAWRAVDPMAAVALFTEDASYRQSPYEQPHTGHRAIAAFWDDGDRRPFTMSAEPVAVDGDGAVVRVHVGYGDPGPQEYRDLWVLTFATDGRVRDFEEWPYWPGKPYVAE